MCPPRPHSDRPRGWRQLLRRSSHYDPSEFAPVLSWPPARARACAPPAEGPAPVCGRPMVAWPILAAREAGAGRIAAIVSPDHDLSAGAARRDRDHRPARARRHRRRLRAALPLIAEAETVLVLSGDLPLVSAEMIAGLLAAHAARGAAATVMTTELDDPGSYGRVVRAADGEIERIVEAKAAGDATPEELAIKEINAGTYAFEPARSPRRSPASPTTTPRASTTCPTSCRRSARPATRSPPTSPPTRGEPRGQRPRRPRRGRGRGAPPDPRGATCSPASRSSTPARPGSTPTSRSPPTPGSSPAPPCAARPRRRRHHGRAADDADRLPARRARRRCPTPTWSSARSPTAARSAPSPTCGRAPARRGRQGGHLRRDQELADRRRRQGPAPLLHRRRRRGRRAQPRRRHDHRQLRRIQQAPHQDRQERADRR